MYFSSTFPKISENISDFIIICVFTLFFLNLDRYFSQFMAKNGVLFQYYAYNSRPIVEIGIFFPESNQKNTILRI